MNRHLIILLQDTAGSERYESMSRIYYRGAKAAIVCYGKCIIINYDITGFHGDFQI